MLTRSGATHTDCCGDGTVSSHVSASAGVWTDADWDILLIKDEAQTALFKDPFRTAQ